MSHLAGMGQEKLPVFGRNRDIWFLLNMKQKRRKGSDTGAEKV